MCVRVCVCECVCVCVCVRLCNNYLLCLWCCLDFRFLLAQNFSFLGREYTDREGMDDFCLESPIGGEGERTGVSAW